MTQTKFTQPISQVPKRSPEERNIHKQLGKVRRYLASATEDTTRNHWKDRIAVYEKQLVKAEARARFIK